MTQVKWLQGLTCQGYRLPTEAEWEHAARARQGTRCAGSDDLETVAWFRDNSRYETHLVKTLKANAWGLFDMSGNVWEWVWDWYRDDYCATSCPTRDPLGPGGGRIRVARGGSWSSGAGYARVAHRSNNVPGYRDYYLGFRVARSLP